jgi:hypothetical protein
MVVSGCLIYAIIVWEEINLLWQDLRIASLPLLLIFSVSIIKRRFEVGPIRL